ncbi:LysR family transcriptional regulator [Micromonospora eburnea]|uniref:DNA-binding transcriptional regulator, LysR family n=1 Tax=Micromonospora eburnea TaxID=227316 RepID=A0A1C6U9E6_9ACTN|nr:LysR family transcriptional regulator [Micromonospora eburnea]SCL50652.1 DNA-binding transcriptional regulator, LysR family [Micromonospora eburnea]
MEVRQLRYFVAVAECEHFGRAAESLHIVQSAVSKQVAQLERELGLTLFDRSHRRARLTPDGQAFLAHARRALRGIDRAAAAAVDIAAGNTGLLRIGSSVVFNPRIEAALASVRNAQPGITLQVTSSASTTGQLAALAADDLDAAFVTAPPDTPGVRVHHLWDEPLVLAVPAAYARIASNLATLAELPLARPARADNPGVYDLVTAACQAAGFTPRVGPALTRVQDLFAGPIASGRCWTLLPAGAVSQDSTAVALVQPDPPFRVPAALALPDPAPRASALSLLAAARTSTATKQASNGS